MKRLLLAVALLAAFPVVEARAADTAFVVTACGTPPIPYVAGQAFSLTMDINGVLCSAGSAASPLPVSASRTKEVCVIPTVTISNNYGANYVVGGLLTFASLWGTPKTGVIQSVAVTIKKVESSGFTLVLFATQPTASTWTDAAVAAINAADVPNVRESIPLTAYSGLGGSTTAFAAGLGIGFQSATTSLYAVLLANAALTTQLGTTTDVQVCVTALQD